MGWSRSNNSHSALSKNLTLVGFLCSRLLDMPGISASAAAVAAPVGRESLGVEFSVGVGGEGVLARAAGDAILCSASVGSIGVSMRRSRAFTASTGRNNGCCRCCISFGAAGATSSISSSLDRSPFKVVEEAPEEEITDTDEATPPSDGCTNGHHRNRGLVGGRSDFGGFADIDLDL